MAPPWTNVSEAALRLAGDVDWLLGLVPGLVGTYDAPADPMQALSQHLRSTSIGPSLQFGVIADSIPYAGCYRVLPESGRPLVDCYYGKRGSISPLGVADGDTLPPGTHVYYIHHPTAIWGLIVAVVPPFMSDPREGRSDQISLASRCGIRVDKGFQAPFKLGGDKVHGGIEDRSARTPTDSLNIGEFVKTTETGLMLSLDPYMAQFRVDAMTGLWMFYWDQLVRLAGYNFQRWTCGSVLESYDDEGEHLHYHGIATYLWEAVGKLGGPGGIFKERGADETQTSTPEYTRQEPDPDDVQEFHRVRQYGGYLGQGIKEIIVAPPDAEKHLYSEEQQAPGLYEFNRTIGGQAFMRAAGGISLVKRILIPSAKRMKLPIDTSGDSQEGGYSAAGQFGSANHRVKLEPTVQGEDGTNVRAAGLMDLHAYVFNWGANHPFHYHEQDYFYPEESELEWADSNEAIPNFAELKSQPYLSEPPAEELTVDHRYGPTKYYKALAYHSMTNDGSVIIGGGGGCEIKMVSGNIHLQCPGTIFFEAGVNINAWAGRDVNIRGCQNVDVVASNEDVRIKAEHNIQALAGNDEGPYGILLESRGSGPAFNDKQGTEAEHAGVILRAPNAQVVGWGREIYMRTGGGDIEDGPIVLDASKGRESVISHAAYHERFTQFTNLDYFGNEGSVRAANMFSEQGAGITGPLSLTGGAYVTGGIVVDGNFQAVGGHIYTENAASGNTEVAPLEGQPLTAAEQAIESAKEIVEETLPQTGETRYESQFENRFYESDQPGSDEVMRNTAVSLRSVSQYKSDAWFLYEARWAQMARAGGGSAPDTWTENAVQWNNQETYPFPGKERFSGASYKQLETELYNQENGRSKDRGSVYENPQYATPKPQPLDGTYPIVG